MTDPINPKVNRCLKDKHFDHLDHALGRPVDPLRESFRNHFCTGGKDAEQKAASPHWDNRGEKFESMFFSVSDEGRKALAAHLKEIGDQHRHFVVVWNPSWADEPATMHVAAKTHADARYDRYLSASDVNEDLTYMGFSKNASVKLYRGVAA